MINTDDNFDHMKFFHDILMAFNSLKTSSTKIDNTNTVIEQEPVSYVLQYSYIDKENDKITSTVAWLKSWRKKFFSRMTEISILNK